MGHRNIQVNSHVIGLDPGQQGHSHLHPDPCVFYGSRANFPHPNVHSVITAPGNLCNFNIHPMPELIDSSSFYATPLYNTIQPQLPAANLDLSVAALSAHYNPNGYMWNTHYLDDVQSFKRKSSDEAPVNYPFQNASAGPNSSVAPTAARPVKPDISHVDAASFPPAEYGGSDPSSTVGSESRRLVTNRSGFIGPESTLPHDGSHVVQGNWAGQPVQLPSNAWLGMHFGATNGDIGTLAWSPALNPCYVHGVPGYQATAGFLHPPVIHFHSNSCPPVQPAQAIRGYRITSPLRVTTSPGMPPVNSSTSNINTLQDAAGARPTFLAPVPLTNFWLHQPRRREIILDYARQHNFPHLRALPEDEVAILEIPDYHEAGDYIDQHRDMRLDIDHMSYEELLALGEHIGSVETGLTEDVIRNNLKTRTFTSSPACINLEQAPCPDQPIINFCVVCQAGYEYEEKIGKLDCGHEYHAECIMRWLLVKNTCAVCKSTALSSKK